ncbi:hypothetical protein V8C34DRAFT_279200 [Trichoderma compactum]
MPCMCTRICTPYMMHVRASSMTGTLNGRMLYCARAHSLPQPPNLASAVLSSLLSPQLPARRICRLRTEDNVICQSGGSSQGSGSIRQDCQGCICISTLCYERLQRRACRMSSTGSRVPKVPGSRFVVSDRFHDICPSRSLVLLTATERSRVLRILGANDEWQRLEVLWWIVYVGMNHHRFLGYSPIKRRNKSD